MPKITSVCVYCGSHPGKSSSYVVSAEMIGRVLAEQNIRLVYGGGTNGLMGALAKGARANGGSVTGIIPEFLLEHEANSDPSVYCDEVIITESMHQRKHKMFEQSDAFLALPGGIGTLEELVEIMTWAQLGRHEKPITIFDIDGFWEPLVSLMSHMEDAGFLHNADRLRPTIFYNTEQVRDWLR